MDLPLDIIGVPISEISSIASAIGGIVPAVSEIRFGDKIQIIDGIFAIAISAEKIGVFIDPALAPLPAITALAEILIKLAVIYGKPPDISDPSMQKFDGEENVSD